MTRLLAAGLLAILVWMPGATAQDAPPEPVKPALLVMDIQNRYIPMMDESEQEPALRRINAVIWQFRQFGLPVICVYHSDLEWGPAPGSDDFAYPETIGVQDDDPQIIKNYPSAFTQTDLDALLTDRGVNTLFLCGLSATGCVLATYFGAMERDYAVFMVEKALLSPHAAHTKTIEEIVDSVGWKALETLLRAAAQ